MPTAAHDGQGADDVEDLVAAVPWSEWRRRAGASLAPAGRPRPGQGLPCQRVRSAEHSEPVCQRLEEDASGQAECPSWPSAAARETGQRPLRSRASIPKELGEAMVIAPTGRLSARCSTHHRTPTAEVNDVATASANCPSKALSLVKVLAHSCRADDWPKDPTSEAAVTVRQQNGQGPIAKDLGTAAGLHRDHQATPCRQHPEARSRARRRPKAK